MVPTYNEAENVEPLANRILATVPDCRLLFIDDNSPDGTGHILDRMALAEPRITVIHRTAKNGIGVAHLVGIDYAYDNNFAVLVTMDGDLTHVPEHIPLLLDQLRGNEVVAGSRFHPDGDLENWPLVRKALAHGGHVMTRLLLGFPHDANGAFRAYDLSAVPREVFRLARSTGYSFFFETMTLLTMNGARISEIPVVLPARASGRSKMRVADGLTSVKMLLMTAVRMRFRAQTCLVGAK